MNKALPVLIPAVLYTIGVFLVGFAVGQTWWGITSAPAPRELSQDERINWSLMERTVPMTVRLEIEDPAAFEANWPGPAAVAHSVEAYTQHLAKPCTIHLRAGKAIIAHPASRRATWIDREDGDTIAHELLHCIRGRWHP